MASEAAPPPPGRRPRLAHDRRLLLLALLGGAPALATTAWLLWRSALPDAWRWGVMLALGACWLAAALALRTAAVRPLQTLANVLGAMRHSDFSLRAAGADPDDPLGLAFHEANQLATTLREERLGAIEAAALLRRVMEEVDVALFAFDEGSRLRLVNRAGERLLALPAERLVGMGAADVGLGPCLDGGETPRLLRAAFPGGAGPWELRRGEFRLGGRPHVLLLLADVSRTLREEEREAWRRLVRVLSHEINNSLAPITSIAGSLQKRLDATPAPDASFRRGLAVIEERGAALVRFIGAYATLSKLPPPQRRAMAVEPWVRRVAALEARVPVSVAGGPELTLDADPDQLDQLLINLLRNGAEAVLEAGAGEVQVRWTEQSGWLELCVDDGGPGVGETANLFVPFFTTKEAGSGIGLVLCRQIAEGHGGSVALGDRPDGPGARATLRLPLSA